MVSELRPTFFLPHPNLARWKLNTGDTKTSGLPHPLAPTQRAIFWHRQDITISHPSPATISEAKFGECGQEVWLSSSTQIPLMG